MEQLNACPYWPFLVAALIPIIIFGITTLIIEIVGAWFILLMMIPVVNLVVYIIILDGLSRSFGKGTGFTIGLFFLRFIFIPILGFDKSVYQGNKSNFGA